MDPFLVVQLLPIDFHPAEQQSGSTAAGGVESGWADDFIVCFIPLFFGKARLFNIWPNTQQQPTVSWCSRQSSSRIPEPSYLLGI